MSDLQTLKEVKDALKKVERKKNKAKKNKEKTFYSTISKEYKKIDWRKSLIETTDLHIIAKDSIIGVISKARDLKKIKVVRKNNGMYYYSTMNIGGLFLLQEQMCQMDDYYFSQKSEKSKYKSKKYISYYFDSLYLGKCYICSHPESLKWKHELLTDFLQDKQFIFDESNPFGRPLKEVRQFISKKLMNCKVEKWDYQFQRFLAKKD